MALLREDQKSLKKQLFEAAINLADLPLESKLSDNAAAAAFNEILALSHLIRQRSAEIDGIAVPLSHRIFLYEPAQHGHMCYADGYLYISTMSVGARYCIADRSFELVPDLIGSYDIIYAGGTNLVIRGSNCAVFLYNYKDGSRVPYGKSVGHIFTIGPSGIEF